MLKPNETSLKCKYQLKQIKITRKKNFATDRKSILSKMGLKFRKCKFNILCKTDAIALYFLLWNMNPCSYEVNNAILEQAKVAAWDCMLQFSN